MENLCGQLELARTRCSSLGNVSPCSGQRPSGRIQSETQQPYCRQGIHVLLPPAVCHIKAHGRAPHFRLACSLRPPQRNSLRNPRWPPSLPKFSQDMHVPDLASWIRTPEGRSSTVPLLIDRLADRRGAWLVKPSTKDALSPGFSALSSRCPTLPSILRPGSTPAPPPRNEVMIILSSFCGSWTLRSVLVRSIHSINPSEQPCRWRAQCTTRGCLGVALGCISTTTLRSLTH